MELGFVFFFFFAFYKVISVSLPESRVWWVNLCWFGLLFFYLFQFYPSALRFLIRSRKLTHVFFILYFIYLFLNFIIQHLVDLELGFIPFFFAFYKVILVSYLSHEFGWLTLDDFFLIDMFFNSSFNIGLIENWASLFRFSFYRFIVMTWSGLQLW